MMGCRLKEKSLREFRPVLNYRFKLQDRFERKAEKISSRLCTFMTKINLKEQALSCQKVMLNAHAQHCQECMKKDERNESLEMLVNSLRK